MAQTVLEQVLEQIKTLNPDELRAVDCAVQAQLEQEPSKQEQSAKEQKETEEEARKREVFHALLLASGLVKEIRHPVRIELTPLIEIEGEPVSETIIRERG